MNAFETLNTPPVLLYTCIGFVHLWHSLLALDLHHPNNYSFVQYVHRM